MWKMVLLLASLGVAQAAPIVSWSTCRISRHVSGQGYDAVYETIYEQSGPTCSIEYSSEHLGSTVTAKAETLSSDPEFNPIYEGVAGDLTYASFYSHAFAFSAGLVEDNTAYLKAWSEIWLSFPGEARWVKNVIDVWADREYWGSPGPMLSSDGVYLGAGFYGSEFLDSTQMNGFVLRTPDDAGSVHAPEPGTLWTVALIFVSTGVWRRKKSSASRFKSAAPEAGD